MIIIGVSVSVPVILISVVLILIVCLARNQFKTKDSTMTQSLISQMDQQPMEFDPSIQFIEPSAPMMQ